MLVEGISSLHMSIFAGDHQKHRGFAPNGAKGRMHKGFTLGLCEICSSVCSWLVIQASSFPLSCLFALEFYPIAHFS